MRRILAALALLLCAAPASAQLALDNFSATGAIHMRVRITATLDTRTNGQVNIWASSAWEDGGVADPTGSIEEGSWTVTGIPPGAIEIRRMARWSNLNRLIFNTTGTGAIHDAFDNAADPYRVSIVREVSGTPVVMTWTPPRSGGNASFIDWREEDDQTMTALQWQFISAIATNDSVIVAIHQGTGSYTVGGSKQYVGGVEIVREYVGDVEIIKQYVGAVEIAPE